jgi:hypothetical protein
LSSESAVAATPAKDEKSFNTSQHVELVVQVGLVTAAVAGKVTEEQLIEAAFLSNLDYHHAGKEITLRCVSSQDFFQQPRGGSAAASSTNSMTNVFRSNQQEDTLPYLLFESRVWGWPMLTVIPSKM